MIYAPSNWIVLQPCSGALLQSQYTTRLYSSLSIVPPVGSETGITVVVVVWSLSGECKPNGLLPSAPGPGSIGHIGEYLDRTHNHLLQLHGAYKKEDGKNRERG